ncbi:general substrate transporter [Calothrix sp. NIES-4071]|nr:general substrate transporter [Calothrix sp. NIES-4071]BAZ60106.1 general substrate transporter [Calothrix sp. NIES-4105]
MEVLLRLEPKIRNYMLTLFAAGLLFWSSIGASLSTLPLYIEQLGGSKREVGFVMGSFAVGLLIFRPQLGELADRRSRKIVLIIGALVAAIAPLGYQVFTSIPGLMALRAFHGISIAAFTTAYAALVTDIAPAENRGEVLGYMTLTGAVGLALGPAIGTYIQENASYTLLFNIIAILGLLSLLFVLPIENFPVLQNTDDTSSDENIWQVYRSQRVRVPALTMLLIGSSVGTLNTFIPLFIKSIHVDFDCGLFYTIAAVSSLVSRFFTGGASDRIGRGLFVTLGLIGYTLSMLLLWQANNDFSFIMSAVLEGAGGGTFLSTMDVVIADRSLPQERGRIFALCVVGFDLGIAIAGPLGGSLAEQVGYGNMFGVAGALTFSAVLIFLTLSNKNLINSLQFALGRGIDDFAFATVKEPVIEVPLDYPALTTTGIAAE